MFAGASTWSSWWWASWVRENATGSSPRTWREG